MKNTVALPKHKQMQIISEELSFRFFFSRSDRILLLEPRFSQVLKPLTVVDNNELSAYVPLIIFLIGSVVICHPQMKA